jgi:outer membrane immunogenic protein
MKNSAALGSIVFVGMIAAGLAQAAELAQQGAPPAPAGAPAWLSWTGVYAGIHLGSGWATTDWSNLGSVSPPSSWRSLGSSNSSLIGAHIGANWQSGRLVFGVEADASASDLEANVPCVGAGCSSKALGTITGRVGVTTDHSLLYLKGGAAGR